MELEVAILGARIQIIRGKRMSGAEADRKCCFQDMHRISIYVGGGECTDQKNKTLLLGETFGLLLLHRFRRS